jgi:hypothetical protein
MKNPQSAGANTDSEEREKSDKRKIRRLTWGKE